MDEEYSTHRREKTCVKNLSWNTRCGRKHLGELDVNDRIL
jgi:hypothetical protein